MSNIEIRAEEQAAANKKGQELFDASAFKEEFQLHFEISGSEAMRGSYSDCSFKGEAWTAELTPKSKLKYRAGVRAVFPIIDDERLAVSITAREILGAIESALEHPFVVNRLSAESATGIRLLTLGDRLHWNTQELIEFIEKITGAMPNEADLGYWSYFSISSDAPPYTSFYFNTKTKEIILEDDSKWPREPYLMNAAGTRIGGETTRPAKALPDAQSQSTEGANR